MKAAEDNPDNTMGPPPARPHFLIPFFPHSLRPPRPLSFTPFLSVVIPVHNEAGNLIPLLATLTQVLATTSHSCEILLVNDGSTDDTAGEIAEAIVRWPQCFELQLPSRRGQATALLAGLQAACGQLIATLDGDGQNDPRDLPTLIGLVHAGACDLACGWRRPRHDSALRRLMSRLANAVRRIVLRDHLHDAGCQLRVMRRAVVDALEPMELLQSFLPAVAVAAGFQVKEMPVRHHPRRHGRSKYGFGRLWWRPAWAMLSLRLRLGRKRRATVPPPQPH